MKPENVVVGNCSKSPCRSSDGVAPFFVQRWWKHKIKAKRFFHLLVAISLFTVMWVVLSSHVLLACSLSYGQAQIQSAWAIESGRNSQNSKLNPTFAHLYYAANKTGSDISYPQCGTSTAPKHAFGIVGVTGGKAFSPNPCLAKEFAWAGTLANPGSLYMNVNAPVASTAFRGMNGHFGNCTSDEKLCQAQNYGYNAAKYAFNYAAQQNISSPIWWLDIETANSWSPKTAINRATIDGAAQFFSDQGGTAVGIYSTPSMWRSITGSYSNGLPVWLPGGAVLPATYCSSDHSFTGGPVYLVQYISRGFDTDYAC